MIKINDDNTICYQGKDKKETLYHPCDIVCKWNNALDYEKLENAILYWQRCLFCHFFIPIDLHEE